MTYSAQGSITIKRLRNGDNFFISLEVTNGIPLFQEVDDKTGAVSPDWTVAANQPIITPRVTSARGNSVSLSMHTWKYNGIALNFNGTTTDGWTLDSTGKFRLDASTGALKIVGNLASTVNIANDALTYECLATISGVEYHLTKSVDILIKTVGANGYVGFIMASTEQLTAEVTTTTLKTRLMLAANDVTSYYVKWYKDDTLWSDKNGQTTITVGRGDVDGTQLFIAEFYQDSTATTPVYRAGIRIIDTLDEFQVQLAITSVNKEVSPGNDVTVKAKVVNMRTNSVVNPSGAVWSLRVMEKKGWVEKRRVSTDTITITTADTDDPNTGEENDVEIHAEVDFN